MIFSLVLEPCGSRVMVTLGQVGDAGASTTAVSTECVLMWPASKGVGKPTYRVGSRIPKRKAMRNGRGLVPDRRAPASFLTE